jgi:hypothetical protein
MKRIILLLFGLFMFFGEANATHLIGGEIIWECHPTNGNYRFTVRLYRECGTPNPAGMPGSVSLTGGPVTIQCSQIQLVDVSPDCYDPSSGISCGVTPVGQGAIQMGIFRSAWTTLNGIPPAGGWQFQWGSCCRPATVAPGGNLVSSSFLLRAIMYPYNNTNASNCYDSSPDFLEDPKVVACNAADIVYNNLGFDKDLDSLYYTWGYAKQSSGLNATYNSGYAFNNPIPDASFNSANTGAQLDGASGQVNFTCFTNGAYATVLKVEEWRCGQLIGEIFRDIPLIIRPCIPNTGICPQTSNNPPSLNLEVDSAVYPNGPWVTPIYNTNNILVYYETTVYAKEQINFKITSFDLDFKPNCLPQDIVFTASGGNLSDAANYGNPNSCKYNAPCATIASLNLNGGFTNLASNKVSFQWQTDCPHLTYQQFICGSIKSVYEFYFRMQDDACPTPGFSYATYKVSVLNYPPVPPIMDSSCVGLDDASGDLSFDWIAPVDTGIKFDYYVIYHATSPNGPFNAIDTVYNYLTTMYTHSGQTGTSNYYFVRTAGGCSLISEPSDTVALVLMTLTPWPAVNSSVAILNWTSHTSKPNTNTYYQIWRRVYQSGQPWALIDSTTNLAYNDSIDICSDDLEYEIRIRGKCFSTSDHAIFSDQTNNEIIVIDSVTVSGNTAVLNWEATTQGDIVSYLVMWFDPSLGAYVAIDTVPVGTAMPYVWQNTIADQRSERYVVVSLDSCGNQSSELNSVPHESIHLTVTPNACEGFTRLRWNEYLTFGGTEYDVLVDIKDDNGNQLATGALLSANGTNLTYTHNTLISGYEYCYYIRAKDSTGLRTSTSNVICLSSLVVKKSRLLYLASTNVRSNGSIELFSFIDSEADVISFSIERSVNALGPYLTVGTVPKPSTGPWIVKYSDYSALPGENRYYYRLAATDSCGAQDTVSNFGTNILLEVTRNGNLSNTLVWNKYQEYGGIVGRYEVYRTVDNSGQWQLVTDQLTENDTVFNDDIKGFATGDGKFCYFVVAVEANNPLSFTDENGNAFSSRSNEACVVHEARMFIPTAFNPSSSHEENTVWKPVNIFAQGDSYTLEVYNRWGSKVFSTASVDEGWDGGDAPMGVYNYFLRYKSLNGIPIEERGSFTLYRNKTD